MRMVTFAPMAWNTQDLRRDFLGEIDEFFKDIQKETSATSYSDTTYVPPVEIIESDEYYTLSLEVPGLKKEDLKIELNANLLTVSGERKREINPAKGERVQRLERNYGFFKRSFTVPNSIDAEKVEAVCEDGVLQIWLPKLQAARPRQIQINSEKSSGLLSRFLKKDTEEKTV